MLWQESPNAEVTPKELQNFLPKGLSLHSAHNIESGRKSLSQDIFKTIWAFEINVISGKYPTHHQLNLALGKLTNASELIWHDKDKKGRSRTRDYLSQLQSLILKTNPQEDSLLKTIQIELAALIDPLGQSIKPEQIKFWVEAQLKQPLKLSGVKRKELQLRKC